MNAKQEQAAIWVLDYVVINVNPGFEVHVKTCSGGSAEGNCPARRWCFSAVCCIINWYVGRGLE